MSAPKIISTGRCLPRKVLTNDMLSQMVDTSDQWIYTRTGIRQRYVCEEETGLSLAEEAARKALAKGAIAPEDIGVCIVATFSPDYATPSTACLLQQRLGLPESCICFDLNAACSGFVFAVHTANALLENASGPYALVVGCEVLSRLVDWTDRGTCVLFGDGAGAALLRREKEAESCALFGSRGDVTAIQAEGPGERVSHLKMEGKPVFRFAIDVVEKTLRELVSQAGIGLEDLDVIVCHQANIRILEHVEKKLGLKPGVFYKNIHRYGNTSAASIPIALDELAEAGTLKPGMRVALVGFGGGLAWSGCLLTW